jgi:hypothetical protein
MRRYLRSTAIALALSFFLPSPGPVTGLVFNPAAYADPVTGQIPDWIRSACCGPSDVKHLRPDQVSQRSDGWWLVDGFHQAVSPSRTEPSQDGDYWIFYASPDQGQPYCFFAPLAF